MKKLAMFGLISTLVSLSGCSPNSRLHNVSNPAVVKVDWASLSKRVQYVTNAVVSMYGSVPDANNNPIKVEQTWTDSNHKKMYLISLQGHFHERGVSKIASTLSFSVRDDLSKAWDLAAMDDKGNTLWKNSYFNIEQEDLRFEGMSKNWKGIYSYSDVQVWNKDSTRFSSWEEDNYALSYIGSDPKTVPRLKYMLNTPTGGLSGAEDDADLHGAFGSGGAGNGALLQKKATLNASVEWDGKTETFTLHETTAK